MRKEVLEPRFRPVINVLIAMSLITALLTLSTTAYLYSYEMTTKNPAAVTRSSGFNNKIIRSAGSKSLENVGLYLSASGGQVDYALKADGDVKIRGNLIVTGTIITQGIVSN